MSFSMPPFSYCSIFDSSSCMCLSCDSISDWAFLRSLASSCALCVGMTPSPTDWFMVLNWMDKINPRIRETNTSATISPLIFILSPSLLIPNYYWMFSLVHNDHFCRDVFFLYIVDNFLKYL